MPTTQLKNLMLNFYLKKIDYQKRNKNWTITILRHGKTEWNQNNLYQGSLDSPLLTKSLEESKQIAQTLDKNITKIYCSPLKRAKDTAQIYADHLGLELQTVDSFREIDMGFCEGKDKMVCHSFFDEFFVDRAKSNFNKLMLNYPGGESYYDACLRLVKDFLRIILANDNVCIVAHEGVNRLMRGILDDFQIEKNINLKQKNTDVVTVNLSFSSHTRKAG